MRITLLSALFLGACSACTWSAAQSTGCEPLGPGQRLPSVLRESSGVAWSLRHPGVLWSHNDSGHRPELYAIDSEGNLLGTFALAGVRNRDWEDIATGPCGELTCIYIADTGDNGESRRRLQLHRVAEPSDLTPAETGVSDSPPNTSANRTLEPQTFPMILPDGPRDIEALFVSP
ncbi:hypothetical protein ACFL3S_10940 [Gemmatimonadota bacterium]